MYIKLTYHYNIKRGFSLLETLIATAIFLLIVGIMWLFIKQSYANQRFTFGQSIAISEAQRGVESLIKETREALPSDTGSYPIVKADDFEFIFYSDYNKNNLVERIRYYLDGSNFIKGVTEPTGDPIEYLTSNEQTTIISRYVRNSQEEPVFKYYDGNYAGQSGQEPLNTPADISQIRLVHINLKVNLDPSQAPRDYYLESDAQIRNLKDNL